MTRQGQLLMPEVCEDAREQSGSYGEGKDLRHIEREEDSVRSNTVMHEYIKKIWENGEYNCGI